MQNLKFLFLGTFFLIFGMSNAIAQRHGTVNIKNGFGIYGGLTQYDLKTDNFETQAGNGWIVGASATVDIPHKWYNVSYTIQLAENKFGIAASPTLLHHNTEFLDYKVFTAQVALLMHVKLIKSYLTLDLGPMIQYNSELELKNDSKEDYIIKNYETLRAQNLSEVSNFNVDGTIGASAGFGIIRLKAQYIYGFTNILNKLNKQNLALDGNSKFKGNQAMWAFTAMITF